MTHEQIARLLESGDHASLFVRLYVVCKERWAVVDGAVRRYPGVIERDRGRWADVLSGDGVTPDETEDSGLAMATHLGLLCALADRLAGHTSGCPSVVDRLPVPRDAPAPPAVILRRREPPLLADIPPQDRMRRPTADLMADLADLLNLACTVFDPPLGMRVHFAQAPAPVDVDLDRRGPPQRLRYGMVFPRERVGFATVRTESPLRPPGVRCTGPRRGVEAITEARRLVDALRSDPVDVLLLPELSTTAETRRALLEGLSGLAPLVRPAVILIGSEHLEDDARFVNRSWALDGRGREIWRQEKLRGYALRGQTERVEEIDLAEDLVLVDLRIGRTASPICLDLLHEDLRGVWLGAEVDLLLVPAFSPRLEQFHETARTLGQRARVAVVVVNHPQGMELEVGATGSVGRLHGSPGFARLPCHGHEVDAPSDDPSLLFCFRFSNEGVQR